MTRIWDENLAPDYHIYTTEFPCIEGLQKDNAEVRLVMVQSQNGRPFRTRTKRNYEISQRSLRRACQLFQNGHYANNIQGYLERISHAIRF